MLRILSRSISIGIRKEAKNRWERRVPLLPDQVESLIADGHQVTLQPSTKRVVPDEKYLSVGARVNHDLSTCDVIMGVKEVPIKELIPEKTFIFFSHTHKGQPYNMKMLKEIVDRKITLIDYELLTGEDGKRLVQFSRFAGYAGMVDGLHALGHRLLAMGYGNPFLACGMSYMYRAVADSRLDVTRTGMVISDDGLPRELGPLVFCITGDGNVSRGAMYILKCLPHQFVSVKDLKTLVEGGDFDSHKVYIVQVTPKDYLTNKDGGFDYEDYRAHPELYKSNFHETVAPYVSFILNGIFWTEKYPRLMTIAQTRELALQKRLRLLTLADVSCDINGSFEFMSKASTIDDPYYTYDPLTNSEGSVEQGGIQIMSIDNLPTEMPLEASEFFSEKLYPVIKVLAKGMDKPLIKRAMITDGNGLVEKYKYLQSSIDKHSGSKASTKKILLLGSGFVSGPLVEYLIRNPNYEITIASNDIEEAKDLAKNRPQCTPVLLDISESDGLSKLIKQSDIVVSFVPAFMHVPVAEKCIEFGKNMVTASYISPAMKDLNAKAAKKGVTIMNEIGLDPGLDHLTACQIFDEVKANGGVITGFVSWCGGLPAPESSNNPLGYKFSWSPKGVLTAGLNSAKFRRDGKLVEIEGKDLLKNAVDVPIFKGYAFEGLANRDSIAYIDTYKLDPKQLKGMFRGTLRYKGYSELMYMFSKLGLLDTKPRNDLVGLTWQKLISKLTGEKSIIEAIAKNGFAITKEQAARVESALNWLDMTTPVSPSSKTILDAFCDLLQEKLVYETGERDMVAMHHEFEIKWADGRPEKRSSTMIAYGEPNGYSAMAKTVGYPAAVATDMILKGEIKQRGVIAPMSPEIYNPMLKRLNQEGIKFVETVK